MTDTFKELSNTIQRGIDDVKKRLANIEARRNGKSLPFQEVELREDASEARLDEAAREEAKNKLAEFREMIIEEEVLKNIFSGKSVETLRHNAAEETDRALFEALKGNNVQDFLIDVGMADLLGKGIPKGNTLQWVYDYKPFPKRS